jgi:hypothetical protein
MAHTLPIGAPDRFTLVKLRRSVRALEDVMCAAPAIIAALDRADDDQADCAHALERLLARYAPWREALNRLDANEDWARRALVQLEADAAGAGEAYGAAVEAVLHATATASRLIDIAGTAKPQPLVLETQALSPEAFAANERLIYAEAFAGRTRLNSRPLRHLIDVASKCNFRCRTCYQSASQDFIYYDLAEARIAGLAEAIPYALAVNIGGTGEALLSATTAPLARAYQTAGAIVELTTNGSLGARLADAAPFATRINISFDGATAQTFETIRFGGRFAKVLGAIEALAPADRAKINLNFVVTRANAHEAGDAIRIARRLGLEGVSFQPFQAYLPWHGAMALRPQDYAAFEASAAAARAEPAAPPVAIWLGPGQATADPAAPEEAQDVLGALNAIATPKPARESWAQIAAALRAGEDLAPPPAYLDAAASDQPIEAEHGDPIAAIKAAVAAGQAQAPFCLAPFTHLYLQGDGAIRPCCVLRTRMATLSDGSFAAAWNSRPFQDLRARLAANRDLSETCLGCTDGLRFGGLDKALEVLAGQGVDVRAIRRPKAFDVPPALAAHPLVAQLGADVQTD